MHERQWREMGGLIGSFELCVISTQKSVWVARIRAFPGGAYWAGLLYRVIVYRVCIRLRVLFCVKSEAAAEEVACDRHPPP